MQQIPVQKSPLAFYQYGCEAGQEPSSTLVLGHALGADRHMWDAVLPLLPTDLRVVLWEQPGHGRSGLIENESRGATSVADSLHEGLEEIGVRDFHIAGLSLGGIVSLAYAQIYPQNLKSLTMFSSGAVLPPSQMWIERAELVESDGLGSLVEATMQRWFSDEFRTGEGRQEVAKTAGTLAGTDPFGYAQCCRIISNTDLRGELFRVSAPTTLIVGEDDPGMSPNQAKELADEISGAQTEVIGGAKHLTAVECPELVANALISQVKNNAL